MACNACDESKHVQTHCASPTCDWLRCKACGSLSQKNDDGHFNPKDVSRKRNG